MVILQRLHQTGKKYIFPLQCILCLFYLYFHLLNCMHQLRANLIFRFLSLIMFAILYGAAGVLTASLVYFAVPRKFKSSFIFLSVFISLLVFFYTFLYPGDFGSLNKFALTKAFNLNSEILKFLFELALIVSVFLSALVIVKRKKSCFYHICRTCCCFYVSDSFFCSGYE